MVEISRLEICPKGEAVGRACDRCGYGCACWGRARSRGELTIGADAMKVAKVTVCNELGLHLRAAGTLAQIASGFMSDIWLSYGTHRANAKSIMSVLSLAASKGAELKIEAKGEDEDRAVVALTDLVQQGFETEQAKSEN